VDTILAHIEEKVQAAIRQTAEALEQNYKYQSKAKREGRTETLQQLETNRSYLKYRAERLAVVSDILTGRAYTFAEKNGELYIQKGSNARLISLAEKMGLTHEFVQEQEKQKELF